MKWVKLSQARGESLPSLWEQWKSELQTEASELRAALALQGLTTSRPITTHGRNITGARYAPNGETIIYSRTSPVDGSTVRRVSRQGTDDRQLVLQTFSPRFSFSPDGEEFFEVERLQEMVANARDEAPEAICRHVFSQVDAFGGEAASDDRTVIILKMQ